MKVNIELGPIEKCIIAHAKDEIILKNAASGGFVTGLIQFALNEKIADKAVVAMHSGTGPLAGKFRIVQNSFYLIESCSSIYTPIPYQDIIARIIADPTDSKYIVVGRPCQIRGLRKLEKPFPVLKDRIVLRISLFCAWLISTRGVEFLAAKSGIKSVSDIKDISYRERNWPGKLEFDFFTTSSRLFA